MDEGRSIKYRRLLNHPAHKKVTGHSVRADAAKKARSIKRKKDFSLAKSLRLVSKRNNKNIPHDIENLLKSMLIETSGKKRSRKQSKKTKGKKTKGKKSKGKKTKGKKTIKR